MIRVILAVYLLTMAAPAAANSVATDAINALRAAKNRAPIKYSRTLEAAAIAHANDMARKRFFSHKGSDGSNVSHRVSAQGYRWCFVAENIAKGQRNLAEVMRAWKNSPGHRKNMLNKSATEFAVIGVNPNIWVMVLANPKC
ncbi:MAG: CAP domain-containing protein [Sulfitobacter sp.]